jgi:hypothetical protein
MLGILRKDNLDRYFAPYGRLIGTVDHAKTALPDAFLEFIALESALSQAFHRAFPP